MAGFPAPFIKFREDDANGFPLAGGKLYSYAAGTSTPLATYTDQALTVPNANPTILDASGRANVWVQDGVGYKFTLTDALGNLMWTVDNVQVPQIQAPPAAQSTPTGGIIMFGGTTAPVGGAWLMCDGAAVSRSTYAALFAEIGTAYGSGNGSTTFNVPNFKQRFPMGKAAAGTGVVLGSTGGTIDHIHQGPSHTHTIAAHSHTMAHTHSVPRNGWTMTSGTASSFVGFLLGSDAGGGGVTVPNVDNVTGASSAADTGTAALMTTSASGTGDTTSANPPFLTVNFLIKT